MSRFSIGGGLDQVGGVVGRQAPHPGPLLARRHPQHHLGLIARRQREEEVLRLVAGEQEKRLDPIGVGEQRPDVADLPQRQRLAFDGRIGSGSGSRWLGAGFFHLALRRTHRAVGSGRYSQAS